MKAITSKEVSELYQLMVDIRLPCFAELNDQGRPVITRAVFREAIEGGHSDSRFHLICKSLVSLISNETTELPEPPEFTSENFSKDLQVFLQEQLQHPAAEELLGEKTPATYFLLESLANQIRADRIVRVRFRPTPLAPTAPTISSRWLPWATSSTPSLSSFRELSEDLQRRYKELPPGWMSPLWESREPLDLPESVKTKLVSQATQHQSVLKARHADTFVLLLKSRRLDKEHQEKFREESKAIMGTEMPEGDLGWLLGTVRWSSVARVTRRVGKEGANPTAPRPAALEPPVAQIFEKRKKRKDKKVKSASRYSTTSVRK